MRKANREIRDPRAVRALMEEAQVCRVGLSDAGKPYIVPMNFGLGENCLYLHSAPEGQKLEILRRNDQVCFEMDLMRAIVPGQTACGFTTRYESVIGFGRAVIVEGAAEKRAALDRIMAHYGAPGPFAYPDDILARTTVIRIDIESLTGKRHE